MPDRTRAGPALPQRKTVTAEEVLAKFMEVTNYGKKPDLHGAAMVARAINEPEPGFFTSRTVREWARQNSKGPAVELRKLLLRTLVAAVADAEEQYEIARLLPIVPEPHDYSRALRINRIEAMLSVCRAVRAAIEEMNSWPVSGVPQPMPGTEWHYEARRLAAAICDAYRAVGRRKVSFGRPGLPAVIMLQWSLERAGCHKEQATIVEVFRNRPEKSGAP